MTIGNLLYWFRDQQTERFKPDLRHMLTQIFYFTMVGHIEFVQGLEQMVVIKLGSDFFANIRWKKTNEIFVF